MKASGERKTKSRSVNFDLFIKQGMSYPGRVRKLYWGKKKRVTCDTNEASCEGVDL